VECTKKIVERQ